MDIPPLDSALPARSCATCACPILLREVRANSTPPSTEDLVTLLRSGLAPPEIQLRAARANLPLDPEDSLRALLAVIRAADAETTRTARSTLSATPPDRLVQFVRSGAERAEVDVLAREIEDPFVLEEIIRSRATGDDTLLYLAHTAGGRPQEALISNHARLLAEPGIIRALLENPALTSEGRRLLSELTEEFFEKTARRRKSEESGPEDASAASEEAPGWAGEDEDLGDESELDEADDESASGGEEEGKVEVDNSLFIGAMYRRIGLMTISEKIKLAYTGSKEERHILIGDSNKLVGLAVLKSRAITINEAESFAAMRNLDEEIYRRISWNREWMRKPAVVTALVRNPRVPLDIALPLLKRLPVRELRAVFRDRNLQTVLRATARRFLVQKRR